MSTPGNTLLSSALRVPRNIVTVIIYKLVNLVDYCGPFTVMHGAKIDNAITVTYKADPDI